MIAIWGGGTLSTRRLGERLLFCINGIPNNGGDWWEELRDFQKLTTATASASIMLHVRPWRLRAAGAGAGMRVSPVWTAGGNQIVLGMGVARTSLIELLFMFAEFWVEEVFTGGSWICPVAPL